MATEASNERWSTDDAESDNGFLWSTGGNFSGRLQQHTLATRPLKQTLACYVPRHFIFTSPRTAPTAHSYSRIHCTSSPCSFSAAFSSAVLTPRPTPDSGWRSGRRKHGVAPLRTSACTADLCASRGRITTLLRPPLPLPLPAGAWARGAPPERELCHCTQAMIDARTPHVLIFFSRIKNFTSSLRREGSRRTRGDARLGFCGGECDRRASQPKRLKV